MPMLSRISGWLERMFDMSVSDDALDPEDPDGFLMTTPAATPPALPQLATAVDEELQEEPPSFRAVAAPVAAPVRQVDDAAIRTDQQAEPIAEEPALAPTLREEPGEPALEEDAAEPEEPVAEPGTPIIAEEPAEPENAELEDDASAPEASAPAPVTTLASASPDGEGGGSADDMLAMFRKSAYTSEISHFMSEIEDVSAEELVTDAREVLGLLGGPARSDDAA